MRASFQGRLSVNQHGPFAPTARGGEDLRSLVLGVAATLWPRCEDTWFAHGGFDVDLLPQGRSHATVSVEASCPPGRDTLPMASLALTLETALARAATFRVEHAEVSFVVDDDQPLPSTDGWTMDGWATRLLRGASGATSATLTWAPASTASQDHRASERVMELLRGPQGLALISDDDDVAVTACSDEHTLLITPCDASILGVAVTIDVVRRAAQQAGVRGEARCSLRYAPVPPGSSRGSAPPRHRP
ncbi:hypothetical protein [Actinomyces radicidentis]|uniref:hypothetical protein n=1 Tax=Actinomyces radicidentis TaxID=111015 RepID=UPI0026DFF611|nr:hypothetical protein [Actinomyces radicidentis]